MNLPFSREQLFAVIADYNAAVLPAQSALTLLALALVVLVIRRPEGIGCCAAARYRFAAGATPLTGRAGR